ncbi:polynucleotide 5'-hydroxyl-kinase NOL9-like [Selaginella moellendorffii]|uniref:polynucleotide 5'-hydroxyl-kinase NOL9-like n=1 Tax=Selaginella moellendorffii TaxID=88036 RepID=UPI000D1C990B|nr:polynucleotide 5'-hydroxyl-kinase NOL9-like [Selaginella moellendorffii]|eukprot:XP_024532005.1 polynucleotide 5'-hydroxyl-kinase NOL9-like [Selaginella moellendorffii]
MSNTSRIFTTLFDGPLLRFRWSSTRLDGGQVQDFSRLSCILTLRSKGVGYDLLVDILRYSTPTHVVEIHSADHESVPPLPDGIASVLHLERAFSCSTEPDRAVRTAAQLRALRVVHYFHDYDRIDSSLGLRFEEVARTLACQGPYQVSADDLNIVHLHVQVPLSQKLFGLNAQLVGLATSSHTGEEQPPCVGFGIVRAIDADRRILYILTPCSPNVLEGVDTILQGRVDVPATLLQVEGYMCPYLSTSQVVEGTGSSILRRRLPKRKISLS